MTVIQQLSDLNLAGESRKPMNVCVVSSEFLGPVKNGGIATATSALLKQLALDGHRATLVYTLVEYGKPVTGENSWQHWVDVLAADGIFTKYIPHSGDYLAWREKSWHVKEFIRQEDFDLVYFNEHHGSGYYSLLAKRAGLPPFSDQVHCVITHGAMEWVFDLNDQYARRAADLEMIGLERRSVELADVVIGPSSYLLKKYESYGWRLPIQTFQQPYPLFRKHSTTNTNAAEKIQIAELVFFGRLEVRKGLWLFCEALDRLSERLQGKTVTFLGRTTDTSGLSSGFQIVNRSSKWPCRVRLLTGFDQQQALSYLAGEGKLAVMPSLADNSPCVIYECMEAGIPFVSTLGSGADELVHPSCWPDMMVQPSVTALAEQLANILEDGARLGRPRFEPEKNLATWSAWHRHVAENHSKLLAESSLSQSAGRSSSTSHNTKAPLIVIIDDGTCAVSMLIENLGSHIKRFGRRAAYLVLSSRQGDLKGALSDMFNVSPGPAATEVCFLGPRDIEEARQTILASPFVFFMDADVEMLTSFFVLALGVLNEQKCPVVSCVTAVRHERESDAEIEDLPSGDVPGLASLGYAIGGAIWGTSPQSISEVLSSLELYDKQMDTLASASALGQRVMHQCRLAGLPLQLLPIVGGIETREKGRAPHQAGFRETRFSAAALGIAPSVHQGAASWFAMSAFGSHSHETEPAPVVCSPLLSHDHPLTTFQSGAESGDLATLAAAMGRPELSLQLHTSLGGSVERARYLANVATKSKRMRPTRELVDGLLAKRIVEFGADSLPKRLVSHKQVPPDMGTHENLSAVTTRSRPAEMQQQDPIDLGMPQIYVDARRLRIRQTRAKASINLLTNDAGRLFFFDVPLCGNSLLSARFQSRSELVLVEVKVIDQQDGQEIGRASMRLGQKEPSQLTIPLYDVYGWAAISIEFGGAAKSEVIIETIQIK